MKTQHGDVFISANRRDFYVSTRTNMGKACSQCSATPVGESTGLFAVFYIQLAKRDRYGRALREGGFYETGRAFIVGCACSPDCAKKIAEAHEASTDEEDNDETERGMGEV